MIHFRSLGTFAVVALAAGLLSGCAGVVLGAGTSAGLAAAEERGLDGAVDDAKIRAQINDLWFRHSEEMFRKTALNISEGRVLLTGVLANEEARADAVRLTWQAAGVREVYNELQVRTSGEELTDQGRDVVISQRLYARLLFDKEIRNINYRYDVVEGVVYLLGIAQSEAELDRVIAQARDIPEVKGIISHVRLKNDPRRVGG